MEKWVLGKGDIGVLPIFFWTGKLIREYFSYYITIPIFHVIIWLFGFRYWLVFGVSARDETSMSSAESIENMILVGIMRRGN